MSKSDSNDPSERVRMQRERLSKLNAKLARLRRGVGSLQHAVRELTDEQSNVATQLQRAKQAVTDCLDVAETAARRTSRPPAPAPSAGKPTGQPQAIPSSTSGDDPPN